MNIYVAAGLEHVERARALVKHLHAEGHAITYDWSAHGSLQDRPDLWVEAAKKEHAGACQATVLIALLPGGRGTHWEMGAAVACNRKVIIVGTDPAFADRHCIFYSHPNVVCVDDVQAALVAVANINRGLFGDEYEDAP